MYHAYLMIPSSIVCNSSTGESLVGSNPFQNLVDNNRITKPYFELTSECEMAIDYLVLMLFYPFPQHLLDFLEWLSFQCLCRTLDQIVDPELRMGIFDTGCSLKFCDRFFLATACQIQLLLHSINDICC